MSGDDDLGREHAQRALRAVLARAPAAVLLGPRQVGKSTLARLASGVRSVFFDLERPSDLARLARDPEADLGALQREPALIVIDEIQRMPSLFALLRPLLDDAKRKAKYVLLGSASPAVVRGVSESLAGRVGVLELGGLALAEVPDPNARRDRLWSRGGFPRSFLARSEAASLGWRDDYVTALVERDVPLLGYRIEPTRLRRFLVMLAHLHGSILNQSELAASLGVSAPTIASYVDLLEGMFLVRRLPPYYANVGKRLVKAPKVYLRDTGLVHALLGLRDVHAIRSHPRAGASWEGFAIEQVLTALRLGGERVTPYYWRTHGGAEVDLVLELGEHLVVIETKLATAPTVPRGLRECMKDLPNAAAFVLHAGEATFSLGDGVTALALGETADPKRLARVLRGARRRASA